MWTDNTNTHILYIDESYGNVLNLHGGDYRYTVLHGITCITLCSIGGQALKDAQTNRDYVVQEVSDEIHEIIRVLQLTTYDEEEWDADDITVMKRAQVRKNYGGLAPWRPMPKDHPRKQTCLNIV